MSDKGCDLDEDDYMSEAFLKSLQEPSGSKKRSLDSSALTYSERRREALARQKTKGYNMPVKEQAQQQFELGLQTHIPESNVGYKMLLKMGYQKGESLGTSENGLVEPIQVAIKANKSGLGTEDEVATKRKRTDAEALQIDQEQTHARNSFRSKMNEQFDLKRIESDLKKARMSVMTMDERAKVPYHAYWPVQKETCVELKDEEFDRVLTDPDQPNLCDVETPESIFDGLDIHERLRLVNELVKSRTIGRENR
ncbi:G patch domain-containing protein 11 [Batrachochytrium dendrobatidis]|nr:G patch domain-containing protein 11 [Batrachochytrium dendrobatidis]